MRALLTGVLLGAVAALTGCVVGPNYQRAKVPVPPSYQGQASSAVSIADVPWWSVFRDPELQKLIRTALQNNRDLRVAARRVEEARELAVQARAQRLPQIGYQAGISEGKNEALGAVGSTSGYQQGSLLGLLQASWEADVWGRIRRSNEYALAVYLGSEQARRGVMLSLVSSVAQSYFELLELDLQLEIAQQTAESFRGSLDIFQKRLDGGTASRLETARAQAALASTEATLPEIQRQIAIQENEIRLLVGDYPGPVAREGRLLQENLPPEVPVGLPSQLLERRPDVLEAEANVRAANARIGVAAANLFPQIGLTTLLGRGSSPLADLVSGRTNVWSLAANASGPIYQGGGLRSAKRQAVAAWEESRSQYEQAVLAACRDIANALVTREKLEAVRAKQIEAVNAYQDAVTTSQQRYSAGKSSYFEVLEAQQELFPAQNALAQTELERRTVIVQLYAALGGGWKLSDSEWSGPPAAGHSQP